MSNQKTYSSNSINRSFTQSFDSRGQNENRKQAEILRQQKEYVGSPYKSPIKQEKNEMIEQYMDFTVKMQIVKGDESNLN